MKWPVHARKPNNIPELKLFCKGEWAKTPPSQYAFTVRLINHFQKFLVRVITNQGGSPVIESKSSDTFVTHDL